MSELIQVARQGSGPLRLLNDAAVSGKLASVLRQFGVLAGIAAAVALGTWVVLWSQSPTYSLLYGNLSDRDITQVMDALQGNGTDYRVDQVSGAIMVRSTQVHDIRLKLAAAGLPESNSKGFEVLQEQSGFGTSQFIETMRYQHALESELARTVGQMNGVRNARVHLAMPKQSAFLRERKAPSASVLLDLHAGRTLEKGQVAAILHLVASAVPNLPLSGVTVVDQRGKLLSEDDSSGLGHSERQLEYVRTLEERHVHAITTLLERIAGEDAVHVQVAADLDFTRNEQTSETFNPDLKTVRSEQTTEERRIGNGAIGIPGALSNQPPGTGTAPESTAANAADPAATQAPPSPDGTTPPPAVSDPGAAATNAAPAVAAAAERSPESSKTQQVRNYEVDRTIAHSSSSAGQLRRLSVAVLIRNRVVTDAQGVASAKPWTEEELKNFEDLARRAVGFDESRGDSISITTADLVAPTTIEPLPAQPLWEQAWIWDASRQLAGASFALLVLFGVLRPAVKSLTVKPQAGSDAASSSAVAAMEKDEAGMTILRLPDGRSLTVDLSGLDQGQTVQVVNVPGSDSRALVVSGGVGGTTDGSADGSSGQEVPLDELERDLQKVRDMVINDARLAALIMRRWVEAGE